MTSVLFLNDGKDFIEERLKHSTKISLVALCDKFTITEHNTGFSELLNHRGGLKGKSLQGLLLPESQHLLTDTITQQNMPLRLNFMTGNGGCVSIDCYLKRTTAGYMIFADHSTLADNDVLRKMTSLSNEMAAMTRELNRKNRALQEAKDQIKTLRGIIPICSYCKQIRDDKGYWNRLENYISENSEALFSHGICDTCMDHLHSKNPVYQERKARKDK